MPSNIPLVDFVTPLTNMGLNFGSMRKDQKLGAALSALGPNASWEDRANAIMKIDPALGVKLLAYGDRETAQPRWKFAPDGNPYDENSAAPPPAMKPGSMPAPGIRYPSGYEPDPNKPGALRPMEGGPASKLQGVVAGAVSMSDAADKELQSPLADGSGTLESVLTRPYSANYGAAHFERDYQLDKGDVGRAKRAVRSKIEAALRIMTGQAAPQTEVDRYMGFYMPNSTDGVETAKQKIRLLNEFSAGAKKGSLQGRVAEPDQGGSADEGDTVEGPDGAQYIVRGGQLIRQ